MLFPLTSEIKSWFFFCCLDVNSSKPILYIWKRTVDFRVDKLFLKVIITAELKLSVLLSYSFCIVSGKSRCFLVSQKVVHFRFFRLKHEWKAVPGKMPHDIRPQTCSAWLCCVEWLQPGDKAAEHVLYICIFVYLYIFMTQFGSRGHFEELGFHIFYLFIDRFVSIESEQSLCWNEL